MAVVKVDRLYKEYKGHADFAVKDVSFTVADGEFMVLLGPSGCGKTSILRMIAGLEPTTSGDLLLNGKRINDVPAKDRDIAMVFQSYALYPHMDVYSNLALASAGGDSRRRRLTVGSRPPRPSSQWCPT